MIDIGTSSISGSSKGRTVGQTIFYSEKNFNIKLLTIYCASTHFNRNVQKQEMD